jgi:hypothetical protein
MAITTSCKVTYSLRAETVARVQELATQWGIPKSEVIRRVVDEVKVDDFSSPRLTPLQALQELQTKAGITKAQGKKFKEEIRASRRASGRKRG